MTGLTLAGSLRFCCCGRATLDENEKAAGYARRLRRGEATGRGRQRRAEALAAKLYQVEIWARDEFVRKSSFETVVARVERGFVDLKTEISNRLDKMADKIDHIGPR